MRAFQCNWVEQKAQILFRDLHVVKALLEDSRIKLHLKWQQKSPQRIENANMFIYSEIDSLWIHWRIDFSTIAIVAIRIEEGAEERE